VVTLDLATGLLERDAALAALNEAFALSRRGTGRLVLISGDAGIGKSALVREFCSQLATSDRTLVGWCDGLRTPRPLGPFVDIAAEVGGHLEQLIQAGESAPVVLDALVDELRSGGDTVVVLEDVHWADGATLDILGLLGRRVEQIGSLIIVTYRSDGLAREHPLRIVVGDLATVPGVVRLPLEPLSLNSVAVLAASSGIDATDLYAKTDGNPFFVTEVLASGQTDVPDTISDVVLARVARLDRQARELLDAVAIVPQRTELWLLEAIAAGVIGALDACLECGMLVASDHAVGFRHELVRQVVEGSISPLRRVDLHRAALDALRAPPDGRPDLARLAHHAEAANDGPAVLEFATGAAERAAVIGSHREAAAQYARALRYGDLLPILDRAELLERRSLECYLTDQHADAVPCLEKAIDYYREMGDARREGLGLSALAIRRWCSSDTIGAVAAAAEAVSVLEGCGSGADLARAYASAASMEMNFENAASAFSWGERATALSSESGDLETFVYQLNTRGTMTSLLGHPEGRDDIERSIALAVEAKLDVQVGRGYIHLAWTGSRTRDFSVLGRIADGVEYCSEHGLELWRLYLIAYRARIELDQGRWTEAAESASYVLRQPRQAPLLRILALTVIAVVRARRGDPDAMSPIEESLALAAGKGDLQHFAPVAIARTEVAALAGRADLAAEASDTVLAMARERDAAWIVGELAFWRRRAGVDEACLDGIAEPFAAHLLGEWTRAAMLWDQAGCPYEAALALADSGEDDALRQALVELRQLGAQPAAAAVGRLLRRRGTRDVPRGPRPSTRANPAGLTARELEVLAMLGEGLRNAEIADRLVLSQRTVGHHVSATLRKLQVRSRAEASATAVRLGIFPQN
jgi:DNA-binding CsgD family transcriptional regulator/tetratricopeptide (TPR) repeat protein